MSTTSALKPPTHTFSFLVANKPGVLVRIAQIFARRGYNIDSLVVSSGMDGRYSQMTITAMGDPEVIGQIVKQTSKLIDVLHATEHMGENVIQRELALIKVTATSQTRTELLQLVDHFKAQTLDFTEESLVILATGDTEKVDALVEMLRKFGIREIVRTGKLVMARGLKET
jgi:acetolactate synthase-1/3 small subunit